MGFWDLDHVALQDFRPGIRSAAEIGRNLIMAFMEIGPNMEDIGHEHLFDQCGMVVEGEVEMFVGDARRRLRPGQTYFIPSGIRHGWRTLDRPVKLLDVSAKPN